LVTLSTINDITFLCSRSFCLFLLFFSCSITRQFLDLNLFSCLLPSCQ